MGMSQVFDPARARLEHQRPQAALSDGGNAEDFVEVNERQERAKLSCYQRIRLDGFLAIYDDSRDVFSSESPRPRVRLLCRLFSTSS